MDSARAQWALLALKTRVGTQCVTLCSLSVHPLQLAAYGDVASTAANAVLDVAGAKYGLSMDALDAALTKVAGGLDKMAARAGPFTAAGLKGYKGGFEKLAVSVAGGGGGFVRVVCLALSYLVVPSTWQGRHAWATQSCSTKPCDDVWLGQATLGTEHPTCS